MSKKSEEKIEQSFRPATEGWEEDPRYSNAQKEQVLELWEEVGGKEKVLALPSYHKLTLSQIRAAVKGDA